MLKVAIVLVKRVKKQLKILSILLIEFFSEMLQAGCKC